jgi:hypothetical protein
MTVFSRQRKKYSCPRPRINCPSLNVLDYDNDDDGAAGYE